MCLCELRIFTFSNKTAFRRLEHKLQKLDKELKHRRSPKGRVYIIVSSRNLTAKKRERLSYEELVIRVNLQTIRTERIDFVGWDEYRAMRKRVGNSDVFGKVEVKVI